MPQLEYSDEDRTISSIMTQRPPTVLVLMLKLQQHVFLTATKTLHMAKRKVAAAPLEAAHVSSLLLPNVPDH